mmetsp:Transcript_20334/g.17611  ORF Transcript_20334/g.17611 Transcript_20334/m.17611 type:complete len:94 (+) Transcript_20334:148-429(+)
MIELENFRLYFKVLHHQYFYDLVRCVPKVLSSLPQTLTNFSYALDFSGEDLDNSKILVLKQIMDVANKYPNLRQIYLRTAVNLEISEEEEMAL